MTGHPRPFRFGVNPHGAADAAAWRSVAREAEDLGYSVLLVPDHLNPQLGPFSALAFAAAATTTLRLGTQVICNEFRHPAVTHKELATLDLLSEGRLEWGMGAGWLPSDFDAIGGQAPPADRLDRLIESVSIMKALFTGEAVDHDDDQYRVVVPRGGDPRPVQRPHPPLIVGGSQQRLLTFAGAEADIVSISPGLAARAFGDFPPSMSVEDNTTRQVGWVRDGAGERFDQIELSVVAMPAQVTDDPDAAAERVGPNLGISPAEARRSVHVLLGSVEEICDTLVARRERWGISNVIVPWQFARGFAPIVERLTGT